MAGTLVNSYSTSDVNITNIMAALDLMQRNICNLILSNLDTTDAPEILTGSIVNVAGATYMFDADTAISGSASDGIVYIKMVPYLDGATFKILPTWTNTAPEVSQEKQGLYGTGDSSSHRYVYVMIKSGTSYSCKMPFFDINAAPPTDTQRISDTYYTSTGGSDTYTYTFTFPFAVAAITNFEFCGEISGVYLAPRITSITISGNTVVVVATRMYSSSSLSTTVNLLCTAVGVSPNDTSDKIYSVFGTQALSTSAATYTATVTFPFIVNTAHVYFPAYTTRSFLKTVSFSGYTVTVTFVATGYTGTYQNWLVQPFLVMATA